MKKKFQPQRGCVVFSERNAQSRRNRVAVENKIAFFTQGSRSGNPGLEAIAPLGHHRLLILKAEVRGADVSIKPGA